MSQPPTGPPRSSAPLFLPSRRPSSSGTGQPSTSRLPSTTSTAGAGASDFHSSLPGATAAAVGARAGRLSPQQTSAARFAQAMDVDPRTEGGRGGSPAPRSGTEQGVAAAQVLTSITAPTSHSNRPISRLPGSSSASASPNPSAAPLINGGKFSRLTAISSNINRSHPGLQPPQRPPSTPSLDLTLRRLLLLLPTLLESHSAPPLPMLDGLFPGEVREAFEAKWKEEEKRKGEERRRTTQAALKASEGEIRSYIKNLVEEVGGAGVEGRDRLEKLESGLKELLARPVSTKVVEEKMERMEKKIQVLETSLARQRTAYEAQLNSYEARFSTLEAHLSASASSPHHPEGAEGPYVTQQVLQEYANKVDQAMGRLDGKGKEVARRVGVEWRSAPKEGEEEEVGLLGVVKKLRLQGEEMAEKIKGVEKTVGELEKELKGVMSKETKEDGGDVEMKDGKEDTQAELQSRLQSLESSFTALNTSLSALTSDNSTPSAASLESQLSALKLSTAELQSSLEAKIQEYADKTGEKLEALRKLTQYFQIDNRLQSFDQLTSHWPAIKLILEAWKAQNPTASASALKGDAGGGEGRGEGAPLINGLGNGHSRETGEAEAGAADIEKGKGTQQPHGDALGQAQVPSE